MFNRINWSFVFPIALIVLALFLSSWLLREKPTMSRGERTTPPITVEVARAEYGLFPLKVKALGEVRAREAVELQPQVEGRVEWLDYDLGPGSTIQQGQLLLRIDAEPYQLALQTARSTLAERRAELQQEQGQRAVAEEEYALLGASLPNADRALVLREPQLAAAKARVDAANAQLNLAQRDLRLTKITSPFTALLVNRTADVGDRVAPGTVLYSLAGASRFEIKVEVPASQLLQLDYADANVRIHGSQWPAEQYRQGKFVRIIPVLEEQGRMARVLVALDDPLAIEHPEQPQLLLNDLARVEITGRAAGQQVRIPIRAIQDGEVVWVVNAGKIHIQPVQIAHLSGDFAVLASGLRGGETLVTTRLTSVTENMPVRIAGEKNSVGNQAAAQAGRTRQKPDNRSPRNRAESNTTRNAEVPRQNDGSATEESHPKEPRFNPEGQPDKRSEKLRKKTPPELPEPSPLEGEKG